MLPDFYKILDVPINATEDEIKIAFRLKAKRLHPDINPSKNALAKFQLLSLAYQTLTDEEKRKKYDLKKIFGIELAPEGAGRRPKHRDPKYRPGAAKAASAGESETYARKEKPQRIIWLENTLFISLLIIGFSALGFAMSDLLSGDGDATEKGVTGLIFSMSFLILLIYGWIFYIKKMK